MQSALSFDPHWYYTGRDSIVQRKTEDTVTMSRLFSIKATFCINKHDFKRWIIATFANSAPKMCLIAVFKQDKQQNVSLIAVEEKTKCDNVYNICK